MVKGTFPPYKPPVEVESKVDNWRKASPSKGGKDRKEEEGRVEEGRGR